MPDKTLLEQQADALASNISGWEIRALRRIGKRIKQIGDLSMADLQSINNIALVKGDLQEILKELAKVTRLNVGQIRKMYGDVLTAQHQANKPLYDYRGKQFVPFDSNPQLQAIARAYALSTAGTMVNLSMTKMLCVYARNGQVVGLQKYYTDILDRAVMEVASGTSDFHTAMRESIQELGGSGMRVDYGHGVTRRLDTVVRQNLLWGAKQASIEYNEMIGEELNADGYEIDWHRNPRPSHVFMQGRQFCAGKSKVIRGQLFPGMDDTRDTQSGENVTESLQDYGCLHFKTPIICGISVPRYTPEQLAKLNAQNEQKYRIGNGEYSGYEVTQMQRRLETEMRKQNVIKQLAQASGDKVTVRACNANIRAMTDKYREISRMAGLSEELPRGTIVRKS